MGCVQSKGALSKRKSGKKEAADVKQSSAPASGAAPAAAVSGQARQTNANTVSQSQEAVVRPRTPQDKAVSRKEGSLETPDGAAAIVQPVTATTAGVERSKQASSTSEDKVSLPVPKAPRQSLPAQLQPPNPAVGFSVAEVPETGKWLRFSYLTKRGYYPEAPGKANQDAFCICTSFGGVPNDHLFAVFDGHGEQGTPCAQFSRDRLAENLLRHEALDADLPKAFNDAFIKTNIELHQSPVDDTMSGSTGIAVFVRGSKLIAANVGDSRAIMAEWRGQELVAVDLSNDQTPFREDECERVQKCGARVLTLDQLEGLKDPNVKCWGGDDDDDGDPPRLWVEGGMYPGTAFTRSLGDSVAEKIGVSADPEVKVVEVGDKNPFFVVASDGVFEFLSSQDVVNMVAKHEDPHAACAAIVAESYRLWLQYETRTDDITIIIVHIDSQPPPSEDDELAQTNGAMDGLPDDEIGRNSMLNDLAVFSRRPVEGTDFDFRPPDDSWKIPDTCQQKPPDVEDMLQRALLGNFLFQQFGEEQMRAVVSCFERIEVEPGDIIIEQGDEGDRFFVCGEGEFDVLVATGQEDDEDPLGTVVHRYSATSHEAKPSFGDLALMYGTRREASVRAASHGVVWSLHRHLFRCIQVSSAASIPSSVLRTLRSIPFLAPLHFGQLHRLACFMQMHTLADGDEIEIQPDHLHVVQSGELEVFDVMEDDDADLASAADDASRVAGANGADSAPSALPATVQIGEIVKRREGLEAPTIGHAPLLEEEGGSASSLPESNRGKKQTKEQRRRRATARGPVRCLSISHAQFEAAIGRLWEQQQRDQKLRTFQALLHLERERNDVSKTAQNLQAADVHWKDTLCGNEWSEIGIVQVPGIASSLTLKTYSKERVAALKRDVQVMRERSLLQTMSPSTFIPPLIAPLSDSRSVSLLLNAHLLMPLALVMSEPLPEICVQHIAASLVLALQMMHKDGIVFRGISPASIFISSTGRVQLADFRFAKRLSDGRTFTLCGSPDFLAPEVIAGSGHGPAADWWALGVLIFMMLHGEGPFGSWKDSELQIYTRIARRHFNFPSDFSPAAVGIIDQLLTSRPEDRLGCGVGGAEGVKTHSWFAAIDWSELIKSPKTQTSGSKSAESSNSNMAATSVPAELLRRMEEVELQRAGMLMEGQGMGNEREGMSATGSASGFRTPRPNSGGSRPWFEGW